MILELKSIKQMKSHFSSTSILKLRFKDLETKQFYNGYLNPKTPELYNTIQPILRIGAHYIGYTWQNRPSLDMRKLTLAAVQPVIYEQTALFD